MMKKNLLTAAVLAFSFQASGQILSHVGDNAIFYVGEDALVYNGGGIQTRGSGMLDIKGNVMIVGGTGDRFETLATSGSPKVDGSNVVLRLNNPTDYTSSTYGQLYIEGLLQNNITGIVSKEYRAANHGNGRYFQQIALPFYNKTLSELSLELNKTFGTTRWTQNEILKFDNRKVVSRHYTSLSEKTSDPTGYYMLGSRDNNLNLSMPPANWPTVSPTAAGAVYTLKGIPYADDFTMPIIKDAGAGIDFGTDGRNINEYNERYNSYLYDAFEVINSEWTGSFGKNLYQMGNPFLTNIDLSHIGSVESPLGDGNALARIWGIRYHPGTVSTASNGATSLSNSLYVTFDQNGNAAGDIYLVIKPMQTFVIKMRDNTTAPTLNFKTLRRFKYTPRAANVDYSVTAAKNSNGTLKQLGVIALDESGNEMDRTYYVVYPTAVSGFPVNYKSVQVPATPQHVIGTYEENAINGGYDENYTSVYWLYINEANEFDFKGKQVPLDIYSTDVKKLKFEVLENAQPIEDGAHALSTGIGFYIYKLDGSHVEVKNNQTIDVTAEQYGLSYGTAENPLGTDSASKPSRTKVVYSPAVENYIVQFDPSWKNATVNVYDLTGKLIYSEANVKTSSEHIINLSNHSRKVFVVELISETGERVNTKIIK